MNFPKTRNNPQTKKTFLVSRLPEDSPLRQEIKMSFDDADKYLKVNPFMVVGKNQN